MQPPARFPEIGEKLANRFRVVFGRGSGPNGMVFKALDLALDLPVAIKVFKPDLFTSPYKEQNLLRLYRARAYQDPNLIKIFEVQEDRGYPFISCQLMEGMSLAAILDLHAESGEHFTIPKVRAIVTRILAGLEAIHRTGAIHGNLKPQNIFVLPDRLVLSDPYYLVAERLKEGQEIPVWDYYRGPEQLTDPSIEMAQTDVYAVALIFGELVGGNPVKPGIPLSAQVPRLTARFDDWFVRATATDPLQRPRTLAEFRDPLLGLLDVVESEGLWQRRYHETGSFRAVRVAVPRDEAIRPVEVAPEPARIAEPEVVAPPAPVVMAPETIPEPPAEALVEEAPAGPRVEPEPVTPEVAVAEPVMEAAPKPEFETVKVAVAEVVATPGVEAIPEPEPEPVEIAVAEPVMEAAPEPEPETLEIAVAEPVTEAIPEPEPEPVEIAVAEPVLEEEGILVSPEPEAPEETIEGIEVLSDETPPIPAEAGADEEFPQRPTEALFPDEAVTIEAPPVPAEALVEPVLPEAIGDTLEMERVVQPPPAPAARMAPMQRVAGVGEAAARPAKKPEAAPIRSFLLLLALFVVVGGVATFAVLWFGAESPQPPEPVAESPRPPVPRPAPAVTPAPAPRDVPAAATTDTPRVEDAGAPVVAPWPRS